MKHLSALALLSVALFSPAWAASPEEAAKIKSAIETYVGSEPGVVEVKPDGNAYAITLNATPYFAKIPPDHAKATADPLTISAEPMGNGQWKVTSKGPWSMAFTVPGAYEMSMRVTDQTWSGTFDEALSAFPTAQQLCRA